MNVKKILSLAVVLAMVMAIVPAFGLAASAADDQEIEITTATHIPEKTGGDANAITKLGTGAIPGFTSGVQNSGDFGTLRYFEYKFTAPTLKENERIVAVVSATAREANLSNGWTRPYIVNSSSGSPEPRIDATVRYWKNQETTSNIDITDIVTQGAENTIYLYSGRYGMDVKSFKLYVKDQTPNVTVNYVDEAGETVYEETAYASDPSTYVPSITGPYAIFGENVYAVPAANAGDTTVDVKLIKKLNGDNIVENGTFDSGLDGWETATGKKLTDVKGRPQSFNADFNVFANQKGALMASHVIHGSDDEDGSIKTSWAITGGEEYIAAVDIQSTNASTHQFAWFNKYKDDSVTGTYRDYGSGNNGHLGVDGDNGRKTPLVSGKFVNKGYLIKTEADDTAVGFRAGWFGDSNPMLDNFVVRQVESIPGSVTVKFLDEEGQPTSIADVTETIDVGETYTYNFPLTLKGADGKQYVRVSEEKKSIDFVSAVEENVIEATYKADAIVSADAIDITTREHVAPVLPDEVKVNLQSGNTMNIAVEWEPFEAADYAEAGSFDVNGTIADTDIQVIAHITVESLDKYTVAWYNFENNGNNTATPGKYDAEPSDSVTYVDGIIGKAASLPGTGNSSQGAEMTIKDNMLADPAFESKAITISSFVNKLETGDTDKYARVVDFGIGDNADMFLSVNNWNSGWTQFKVQGNNLSGDKDIDIGNTTMSPKEWHHFAATLEKVGDNWIATTYIDGKLNASGTYVNARDFTLIGSQSNPTYYIGTSHWGGDPRYTGYFDELKIYSVALTPEEIAFEGGKYDVTVSYKYNGEEVATGMVNGYNGQSVELPDTVKNDAIIYDVTPETVTIDSDNPDVDVEVTLSATVVESAPQDIKAKYIYNAENTDAASVLPKTVEVTYNDESTSEVNVTWAETTVDADPDTIVTKSDIIGTIEGTSVTAKASVDVYPSDTVVANTASADGHKVFDVSYNGILDINFDFIMNSDVADNINGTISFGDGTKGTMGEGIDFGHGGDAVSIQFGANMNVRTWPEDGNTGKAVRVIEGNPVLGKIYHFSIVVNVPSKTYSVKITDEEGKPFGVVENQDSENIKFRNYAAETINKMVVYNYDDNGKRTNDIFRIFNIDIKGSNVPTLTPALGWNNGAFTIDYKATNVVDELGAEYGVEITPSDVESGGKVLIGTYTPATENGIGMATPNTNLIYTAVPTVKVNDKEIKGAATAATGIYGLVMDAIASSEINGLINAEQLAVVNEVLKNGNILLTADENGAFKLTDAAAKVMTLGEDNKTITLTDQAVKLGLKFTNITAYNGENNGAIVSEDGKTIILPDEVTTAEAMVLALESVQLEFVPTEIAESDGADADAVQDFTPEL